MDPSRELALVAHEHGSGAFGNHAGQNQSSTTTPISIATISSGFEKGDFLVREEKGQRVYFDFFEEAFNYIAYKGYIRMPKEEEVEWMDTMNNVRAPIKLGCVRLSYPLKLT